MSIDITGAESYFAAGNHTKAGIWASFADVTADMKKAAIAEAKRILSRVLQRELEDPSDATDLTEFPRDDLATYEQALFILENGQIADGSMASAKFIAGRTEPDQARERDPRLIAPAARRWLFRGVMMSRG